MSVQAAALHTRLFAWPFPLNAANGRRALLAAAIVLTAMLSVYLPDNPQQSAAAAATALLDATNDARQDEGMPRLRAQLGLTRAARAYAELLAGEDWFDHEGPDGSTLVTRSEAAGYMAWLVLAENLARGAGDIPPREVVERWLASPDHRGNLASREFSDTGVGCAIRDHPRRFWCVQLYGRGAP